MRSIINQTVKNKLAFAGLILCCPALACALTSFFLGFLPWYFLLASLLFTAAAGALAFNIYRNSVVYPVKLMREGMDALLEECLGEEPPKDENDFVVIMEALERMRVFMRRAREERESYEENRKDIIAGISHDIGTPLAAIAGCADALLEGIASTPKQKRVYLETIRQKASELNQLSNDFFMFSCLDLDNLPVHLEDMSYKDLFDPILADIADSFSKENIRFEVIRRGFSRSAHIALHIDPMQMKRVFQNLANNCIKYIRRREDENPEVRFCADCLPDRRLRLTLESNGLPVSYEDCARIFTPYFRTNGAKSSAVNGSGIGLTVCKQLVDMNKGTICARQSVMGGLAIEVTFPIV